jgi:hypothetical protein
MSFRWEDLIQLDAKNLAEEGIAEAYGGLRQHLIEFVAEPAEVKEQADKYATCYTVICGKRKFEIYSPQLEAVGWNSWGRATYAFFKILNLQLRGATHRLYAVNGGNDLAGIFLTLSEAKKVRRA